MNKFIVAFFLLNTMPLIAMEADDSEIIPIISNASYVIFEGADEQGNTPLSSSRYASFYTFDGDFIEKIEHHFEYVIMQRKLDPGAPKPQPTFYTIRYWPGGAVGNALAEKPGDFIYFYDKNDSIIERYPINRDTIQATNYFNMCTYELSDVLLAARNGQINDFPLDLSIATGCPGSSSNTASPSQMGISAADIAMQPQLLTTNPLRTLAIAVVAGVYAFFGLGSSQKSRNF